MYDMRADYALIGYKLFVFFHDIFLSKGVSNFIQFCHMGINYKTMEGLLVAIAAFAAIFGIVYVFLMTRHRERMSMLEKGVDPSLFTSKPISTSYTLKIGMLSTGVALGILLGNLLHKTYDIERGPAFLSMVFLFGGLSLIANYMIDKKTTQ